MTAHTPGPFNVEVGVSLDGELNYYISRTTLSGDNETGIEESEEQAGANADLFSAAPELAEVQEPR